MEWTKESLNRTCVEITSKAQMKRVVSFYKSFGITGDVINFDKKDETMIILVKDNHMQSSLIRCGLKVTSINGNKIIKIPSTPRRKFPREMMTCNENMLWRKRVVIGKVKGEYKFVTESLESFGMLLGWKYAKEIE